MPGLRKAPYWVEDRDTGCWNWKRKFHKQTPVFRSTGIAMSARRYIWKALGREIVDRLSIDAGCGNHRCVNPEHYYIPNGGDLWCAAESGCWKWLGSKAVGGYGAICIEGVTYFGHRRIWELLNGPLKEFETLNKKCRQRDCVHPDHHYLISPGIEVTGRGCWEWTGTRNEHNYGQTCFDGVKESAHRRMYRLWYGDLPADMDVLHKCDNPPCCNPEHLFLGTAKDNAMDMVAKGRCAASKLSDEQVAQLREMRAKTGMPYYKLARLSGISKSAAMAICKGDSYPDHRPTQVTSPCPPTQFSG